MLDSLPGTWKRGVRRGNGVSQAREDRSFGLGDRLWLRVARTCHARDGPGGRGPCHGAGHQHHGLLDERPHRALEPRRRDRGRPRPLVRPGAHRLHLERRPVRAHARRREVQGGLRRPPGALPHRPHGPRDDALHRLAGGVRAGHGWRLWRLRPRPQASGDDSKRRDEHPQPHHG